MFSSLTEEDLQVLGITAFGPRKKLLMAINFLSTHHHSHGHLSPQIYHHHPPYNQYMQHAAAMGGRMSHGPQIKNPPGIPAGFEQKIQQQQQQQQQNAQGNGAVGGSTSGSGGQNPVQGSGQGNPEQSNKNTSPPGSGGGGGAGGGQDGAGNVPPKFSGSAAPGAERRTSNSS